MRYIYMCVCRTIHVAYHSFQLHLLGEVFFKAALMQWHTQRLLWSYAECNVRAQQIRHSQKKKRRHSGTAAAARLTCSMYITRGRSCMHEELFCIHMKELRTAAAARSIAAAIGPCEPCGCLLSASTIIPMWAMTLLVLALLMHNSHLISHFCTLTRTWTQGVCHMSS